MTKEITKSIILQEMQDKFKLREFDPANFLFDETVIPVYNIEPHISEWAIDFKTVSVTSAAPFTFFTVPQTERWTLRAYQLIYGAAGAIKGSGAFVRRNTGNYYIYLDLVKGQEVSYIVNLDTVAVLNPNDTLEYMIDTYVSPQQLTMQIDVKKEIIR